MLRGSFAKMMRQRSLLIDLLKIIGSQLIVLHHLVLYAPMAKILEVQLPQLINFLFFYGRLPVSIFLVAGGYLCAHIVDQRASFEFTRTIFKRCLRLLPLYFISIFAVLLVTIVLHPYVKDEPWTSDIPSVFGFLSHLLLLQDLIGEPSISAGAWYVSIDLQLFALTLSLVYLSRHFYKNFQIEIITFCVFLISLVSLHIWSKSEEYDALAFYFFHAYGLGVLAYLSSKNRLSFYFFLLLLMAHAVDIYMYPTPKSSVIFLSALAISFAQKGREIKNRFTRLIESASDISYALFVSHFFVIVVFSGVWKLCGLDGFALAHTMFLATWLVATLMASFLNSFYSRLIVRMSQFKGAVK